MGVSNSFLIFTADFFLEFFNSQLRDCCGFGFRFLRPGCLPGGGYFRLFGRLCDRLKSGIKIGLVGGDVKALM